MSWLRVSTSCERCLKCFVLYLFQLQLLLLFLIKFAPLRIRYWHWKCFFKAKRLDYVNLSPQFFFKSVYLQDFSIMLAYLRDFQSYLSDLSSFLNIANILYKQQILIFPVLFSAHVWLIVKRSHCFWFCKNTNAQLNIWLCKCKPKWKAQRKLCQMSFNQIKFNHFLRVLWQTTRTMKIFRMPVIKRKFENAGRGDNSLESLQINW